MNRLFSRFFLLISFVAVISGSSPSQDSLHRVSTTLELLKAMNTQRNVEQSMDIVLSTMLRSTPELKKYEDVMRSFLSKYISWESLQDKYIALYISEFTEADMQAMIAFYKTDVGKKMIEKVPILLAKGAELGRSAVQEHKAELTEAIQKRAEELNSNNK